MQADQIFEILMRENASMLVAFLRSSVRDANYVDDLFQETMLVAWRRLDEFDRQRAFGPWLRGIAAKLVLAHYRNKSKRTVTVDESAMEWLEFQFDSIQQNSGDTFSEKLMSLRDCVEALPPDFREPIQLRYQQEMALKEIAARLAIAMEALKKRLTRGKRRLADCLNRKLAIREI